MFTQTTTPVYNQLSAQSSLEYIFLRYILARAALPEIGEFTVPQFPVKIGGKFYTIDYGIVGLKSKFAIELDGFVVHSQKSNFNNDRFRGNDLINDGWTLIRFSTENITTSPYRCITQLQDTLARDPFLKNYLLPEIISELPLFSFQDWEAISQKRINIPNKPPAASRANRDMAFNRLKMEGSGFLTNRKKIYLQELRNPANGLSLEENTAQPVEPLTKLAEKTPVPLAATQSSRTGSRSPRLVLIGGLIAAAICLVILAIILLPVVTTQPTSPTRAAPALTQTIPAGNSLADEIAAQPCRIGQLKGSQSKIYYPPGHNSYSNTKTNVVCFNSPAEAEAAGFSKAQT